MENGFTAATDSRDEHRFEGMLIATTVSGIFWILIAAATAELIDLLH